MFLAVTSHGLASSCRALRAVTWPWSRLSRRPPKDLPAGEGWQPVLLLLLLLLLPLRAPPHVQPVSNTASGCAVTFVMESSAEFATSIEMGSSAVCPEPAARLARLERKQMERHRASSARMCARTIR